MVSKKEVGKVEVTSKSSLNEKSKVWNGCLDDVSVSTSDWHKPIPNAEVAHRTSNLVADQWTPSLSVVVVAVPREFLRAPRTNCHLCSPVDFPSASRVPAAAVLDSGQDRSSGGDGQCRGEAAATAAGQERRCWRRRREEWQVGEDVPGRAGRVLLSGGRARGAAPEADRRREGGHRRRPLPDRDRRARPRRRLPVPHR
jgi:hypothetical protein